MKKTLSTPVIIGTVVVAVLFIGFLFFKFAAGPPEFGAKPITGKTPDYIKQQMTPEQRAEVERIEREQGVANANEQMIKQQPQQNPYGGN